MKKLAEILLYLPNEKRKIEIEERMKIKILEEKVLRMEGEQVDFENENQRLNHELNLLQKKLSDCQHEILFLLQNKEEQDKKNAELLHSLHILQNEIAMKDVDIEEIQNLLDDKDLHIQKLDSEIERLEDLIGLEAKQFAERKSAIEELFDDLNKEKEDIKKELHQTLLVNSQLQQQNATNSHALQEQNKDFDHLYKQNQILKGILLKYVLFVPEKLAEEAKNTQKKVEYAIHQLSLIILSKVLKKTMCF